MSSSPRTLRARAHPQRPEHNLKYSDRTANARAKPGAIRLSRKSNPYEALKHFPSVFEQVIKIILRVAKATKLNVEVVHSRENYEEYDRLLEEWSEIVYRYLCQLPENQSKVSETIPAKTAERTGTNG